MPDFSVNVNKSIFLSVANRLHVSRKFFNGRSSTIVLAVGSICMHSIQLLTRLSRIAIKLALYVAAGMPK